MRENQYRTRRDDIQTVPIVLAMIVIVIVIVIAHFLLH